MSKLINVSDKIYKKLYDMKRKESFSVIIEKLIENKGNKEILLAFAGKGKFNDDRLKELKKGWSKWSEKYV